MLRRARKKLLGGAAAAFDRAAVLAAYAQTSRSRKKNPSESLSHQERVTLLGSLAGRYDNVNGSYYREPRAISFEKERPVRSVDGGEVVDVRWGSEYEPYLEEVRERYTKRAPNRSAAARLWLHREPRPAIVLVHGYMAGQHAVEQRMWPTEWLFQRLGLDVAFFVLPFHGVRGIAGRRGPPPFPGSDPRLSNEGFRQAMNDLGDLVHWLRDRGCPSVGAMGMSLGGYTTSLAATVHKELAFAIPVIPLTSLADFARDQGRLGSTPEETTIEHRALDAVHHVVSPLHRQPLLDRERLLVIAAQADRITPVRHAERLADHFGVPLETWHGGHLLQFGRRAKFKRVGRFLREMGIAR